MIVVNFTHDLSVDRKGEVRSPRQGFQQVLRFSNAKSLSHALGAKQACH
jgi:hypothetical protein